MALAYRDLPRSLRATVSPGLAVASVQIFEQSFSKKGLPTLINTVYAVSVNKLEAWLDIVYHELEMTAKTLELSPAVADAVSIATMSLARRRGPV